MRLRTEGGRQGQDRADRRMRSRATTLKTFGVAPNKLYTDAHPATYVKYGGRRVPSLEGIVDMIWLYERGAEVLRIETRFDATASHFQLIWHRPDGSTEVEAFSAEAAFRARLGSVEAALKTEHWNQAGSPQILREGWKEGK